MKQKTGYISLLSVVCCFAVVLLHTNACFWSFSTESYWAWANVIECVAYFAVPCFFMISGATLLNFRDRYTLKEYLKKRFEKTVIPFFAWSFIGFLYCVLLLESVRWEDLSFSYVYNGILNTSFIRVYWFFISLFCAYLSIPLFASVEKSTRREIFSYLAIVGVFTNAIIPFLQKILFPSLVWPFSVAVVSENLLYVIIGYLIHEYELTKKQRGIIYFLAIAGMLAHIVGTYILSMDAGEIVETYKGYNALPCILYSVGIFTWFRYNGQRIMENTVIKKVVLFVSEYTFGIYLIHIYCMQILARLINANVESMVFSLCMPFAVIPVSIAIIWIIKKIPVLRKIVP